MIPDCVYVGDSIAIGLQKFDNSCAVYAKTGASSDYIVQHFSHKNAAIHAVISMGSNSKHNYQNAVELRKTIKADVVIWILPYNRTAAAEISRVAIKFQDGIVDLHGIRTNDGVHPNYKMAHKQIYSILTQVYD
jgi:hypothetical protein